MSGYDFTDSERLHWLLTNAVGMQPADRDGPECPRLFLLADIWNTHPEIPPWQRILSEINSRMKREKQASENKSRN